mgnify:CR=1 FL=1
MRPWIWPTNLRLRSPRGGRIGLSQKFFLTGFQDEQDLQEWISGTECSHEINLRSVPAPSELRLLVRLSFY